MAEARRVRRHLTKRRARDARHDEGDPAIVSGSGFLHLTRTMKVRARAAVTGSGYGYKRSCENRRICV